MSGYRKTREEVLQLASELGVEVVWHEYIARKCYIEGKPYTTHLDAYSALRRIQKRQSGEDQPRKARSPKAYIKPKKALDPIDLRSKVRKKPRRELPRQRTEQELMKAEMARRSKIWTEGRKALAAINDDITSRELHHMAKTAGLELTQTGDSEYTLVTKDGRFEGLTPFRAYGSIIRYKEDKLNRLRRGKDPS
ncbi:hypothetical protein D3C80_1238230 [compost metagenome]